MPVQTLLEWLEQTPWSVGIRESNWTYPIIETTHVLSLALFLGLISMLDLRLLNIRLRQVPVSEVAGRLLPWAFVGFALMVVSGSLLFYSSPVRAFNNIFFRIKMGMLVLAGINAFVFHTTIYRSVPAWDRLPVTPLRARLAGLASLTLWVGVVVSGRMQAYNWFD